MVQCRNCTIIKYKRRTAANQWPKEARATDWPTIRSTTLLTADPESVARKSAFCRPAHSQLEESRGGVNERLLLFTGDSG
jgi:hypothetical protein